MASNVPSTRTEGLNGPNSMYVKLIANDGHEFIVKRELAYQAKTLKDMLESSPVQVKEDEPSVVHLRKVPSNALIVVCRFFAYKHIYDNATEMIPEFPTSHEDALDVFLASDFLRC
ncbi:hypothetical protein Pmani_003593 [Petrolisthes manimaculis]|uniref:Elongin-C n=1 Tax=Petrolisthes manimaculis TaxID=1843537 RepID=A0AAE1QI68_9EUCA|nr:hypothetical protein Pmani_003593 [Petrolisthes manimaculis]